MKLIVGLGNPGKKYEKTRHNLGFMIVEHFLKDFQDVRNTLWEDSSRFNSDISQIEWQPRRGSLEKVILAKPKTYMNDSGMAVQLLTSYYKLLTTDVWIVHDDIDLPLGHMKIRFGGGSAGHRGIESVIEHLSTDKFWRFRMGTGKTSSKFKVQSSKLKSVDDYVLGGFVKQERGKLKKLIKKGAQALETSLEEGLDSAMNRFNTK